MHPVIEWKDGTVVMLDQRLLPAEEKFVVHHSHLDVARSISDMVIRGAPAIGIAAAMGIALGVLQLQDDPAIKNPEALTAKFKEIVTVITATRPTAVNLFWAAAKMEKIFERFKNDYSRLRNELLKEALHHR